jgi:hypothetical protein
MATFTCRRCRKDADLLTEFPGRVCLDCWAQQQEKMPMPTAQEVTDMFRSPKILRRQR